MYNTIRYDTIRYDTIQYNTIQYKTSVQYNISVQYDSIQYNTIQYNTIQYNTIQWNTKQYRTYLHHLLNSNSDMIHTLHNILYNRTLVVWIWTLPILFFVKYIIIQPTWTSYSSATRRHVSMAAGVVPQSSCSFSLRPETRVCNFRLN